LKILNVAEDGRAALRLWPNLPRDLQEQLFEVAVGGDATLRHSLTFTFMSTTKNYSSAKAKGSRVGTVSTFRPEPAKLWHGKAA
jgi:hypothetical protein